MIVPDANLLLYTVNANCREHPIAFRWWRALLDGEETIGLCSPVVFAFVRLSTNRRILPAPLSVEEAFAYVASWMQFPHVIWFETEPSHLEIVKSFLLEAGTGGNLVTDAQIAAVALQFDATVHTADMDFSRFSSVKWKNPLLKK